MFQGHSQPCFLGPLEKKTPLKAFVENLVLARNCLGGSFVFFQILLYPSLNKIVFLLNSKFSSDLLWVI